MQTARPASIVSAALHDFFGEQLDAQIHLAELMATSTSECVPFYITLCGKEFNGPWDTDCLVYVLEDERVADCLACRRTLRSLCSA